MYNYEFENEMVSYEVHNIFSEIKGNELFVNILITDKNLLIFYNLDNDIVVSKTKGVATSPVYELLMKFELDNIVYKIEDNNTYIKDNIILYNFVFSEFTG